MGTPSPDVTAPARRPPLIIDDEAMGDAIIAALRPWMRCRGRSADRKRGNAA